MRYLPQTEQEIGEMLSVIGVGSVDDLFNSIPSAVRFTSLLDVPPQQSESELMTHLSDLAAQNTATSLVSFLGAGAYHHHIPPAVDQLLLRSEFYTAYTPYQPEVAQGTLQSIFEFQTVVSELLGLPLANASMYDGSTAVAEAAQMARRLTKRDRILVSRCIHPEYREVIRTYVDGSISQSGNTSQSGDTLTKAATSRIVEVDTAADGTFDLEALKALLGPDVAACIFGYPSCFGGIKDPTALVQAVQQSGALAITSTTEPYALALAKAPGQFGVDIATAEGQPLATTPNYGGPGVGLFACRDDRKFLQQMPGRICGETVDSTGKRGYVLTLSTREQHIRRERATSNICTNQGLLALALLIRTSLLGKQGFVEVAKQCLAKTEYVKQALRRVPGITLPFAAATFNEFVLSLPKPAAQVNAKLRKAGLLGGLDLAKWDHRLNNSLLIAVTERHSRRQLDELIVAITSAIL
jgi:glycine dehydrogenase subunit 1